MPLSAIDKQHEIALEVAALRAVAVTVMLLARTESVPPLGIASRALTHTLITARSNSLGSTITGHRCWIEHRIERDVGRAGCR